jgi:hypothetical protein
MVTFVNSKIPISHKESYHPKLIVRLIDQISKSDIQVISVKLHLNVVARMHSVTKVFVRLLLLLLALDVTLRQFVLLGNSADLKGNVRLFMSQAISVRKALNVSTGACVLLMMRIILMLSTALDSTLFRMGLSTLHSGPTVIHLRLTISARATILWSLELKHIVCQVTKALLHMMLPHLQTPIAFTKDSATLQN